MAIIDQTITENYALYNGDCVEVMRQLPDSSVDMSIYSPPFCGLYNYSSDEKDLSNCKDYDQFFEHYSFVVGEIFRLTKPGRITAVHCMDIPRAGANVGGGLIDFPGDIIRLHEKLGFSYCARYHIWKEPLGVRNRTMAKGLAHAQIVEDSSLCDVAAADYLLMFRRKGENKVPVAHPTGLHHYAGERKMPAELLKYKGWTGKQSECVIVANIALNDIKQAPFRGSTPAHFGMTFGWEMFFLTKNQKTQRMNVMSTRFNWM